jgi:hypothetical protein
MSSTTTSSRRWLSGKGKGTAHASPTHEQWGRARMAQLGFGLDNISWIRPANATLLAATAVQVVPRRIVQIGRTFQHAANKHLRHMRAWWALNPEYEYRFFSDAHCTSFMREHASADEQRAYRAVVLGAQRADLFRGVYLRRRGGVYADLDCELRGPLRAIVPPDATVVANPSWTFEFLIFAPDHPIMRSFVQLAAANVLREAEKLRDNAKDRCRGPHQCVIRVTGPLAWSGAVGSATAATGAAAAAGLRPRRDAAGKHERGGNYSGCYNHLRHARTPMPGECARASSAELRGIHVCGTDQWEGRGHTEPAWMCGVIRHWDCRQFVQEGCSKTSYRNYNAGFFNASRLLA